MFIDRQHVDTSRLASSLLPSPLYKCSLLPCLLHILLLYSNSYKSHYSDHCLHGSLGPDWAPFPKWKGPPPLPLLGFQHFKLQVFPQRRRPLRGHGRRPDAHGSGASRRWQPHGHVSTTSGRPRNARASPKPCYSATEALTLTPGTQVFSCFSLWTTSDTNGLEFFVAHSLLAFGPMVAGC